VEYADTLKKSLGTYYDADLDKLSVPDRIKAMKIIKATVDKMPVRSEGEQPNPPPIPTKNHVKTHVDAWNAGEREPKTNSVIGVTLFKN